jgi:hypothetical protein
MKKKLTRCQSFGLAGKNIFNSLRLASISAEANAQVYGITYVLENPSDSLAFDFTDSDMHFVFIVSPVRTYSILFG